MRWLWMAVWLVTPLAVVAYAYLLYPLLLWIVARPRRPPPSAEPVEWPSVTIIIPAYNEAGAIAATLDAVLALDYPADRRHVVVVSDASTDGTDDIVRGYAHRGVELVRLPVRSGKTVAENAARHHLRSPFVVNTDASVRLDPRSLKPLVAAFQDPLVGVASGRDVSVARHGADANPGESGYVSYEMWVRDLETRAGGIVGASGCYYASRAELHREIVPAALSRDFAAPLIARENGYRAVSVRDALCYVPRVAWLRAEYRRKVRTMARGLETLFAKRHLMNPRRYGRFAWMLVSHKLARWLVPLAVAWGGVGSLALAVAWSPARWPLAILGLGFAACALLGWYAPAGWLPRPVALAAYLCWGLIAGLHAWTRAWRRDLNPIWEPTRRETVPPPAGDAVGSGGT